MRFNVCIALYCHGNTDALDILSILRERLSGAIWCSWCASVTCRPPVPNGQPVPGWDVSTCHYARALPNT
jgi:hypothetical protein